MPFRKFDITRLVVIILSFVFISCQSNQVKYTTGTLADIFTLARKNNKKVFILITDSACQRCKDFADYLNTQSSTVAILNRDYISCKADIRDADLRVAGRILKCPAYPFPYFFNTDGSLQAFGFPGTKEYDISHIESIHLSEDQFRELFKMNITTEQYKKIVYYCLNVYLEMKATPNGEKPEKAYALARNSVEIAAYPYNTYLVFSLSRKLGLYNEADQYLNQLTSHRGIR